MTPCQRGSKGRPKTIDPTKIMGLLESGMSMRKAAVKAGVSLSTVQRVKDANGGLVATA